MTDVPGTLASEGAGPKTGDATVKAAETPASRERPAQRPAAAIRADIERERAALQSSFVKLRGDLDETLDVVEQRVGEARRKAVAVAPFVAGTVAVGGAALLLLRRRRRTR